MSNKIPDSFQLYFVGIFNSRLIVDLSNLAQRYDYFRILLLKELMRDYDVIFEQYENNENEFNECLSKAEINNFKNPTLNISRIFFNPEYFSQNVFKGLSLICIRSEENHILNKGIEEKLLTLLEEPLKIRDIRFTFSEYGIGIASSIININLRNSLNKEQIEPFIDYIKEAVRSSHKLIKKIKNAEKDVYKAFNKVKNELIIRAPFFDELKYKSLYPKQEFVRTHDSDGKLINMFRKKSGFAHIGWESPLLVNLNKKKRINLF